MRLAKTDTVDYLVVGRDGTLAAVLLDDFQGSDETHRLGLLQAKIARYLDFIESGEAHERFGKLLNHPVDPHTSIGIKIIAMQELGELGRRFIEHVRKDVESVHVNISFEVDPA